MENELKKILHTAADTIRGLSFEAVQKANSGHPGLPMGCAELGAYLYGVLLKHNPQNSKWIARDRFVLSAGHGSMLLYSCLHLAGFKLSMDEIKRFRQLHSHTPGHPEYGDTDGVESTTGPLGQGIGNAVGQAFGLKILGAQFNTPEHSLFNSKVFCLAGDGCLMEGISHEAGGFAGHLQLDNFILIHDANKITLDGPLEESGSEDTKLRFKAYGFDVYEMDGNDLSSVEETFNKALKGQKRPVFIEMRTIIGKGSPNKQGTSHAHGSPLGPEECELAKKTLGLPEENFYVPGSIRQFFQTRADRGAEEEKKWNELFDRWRKAHPDLYERFKAMQEQKLPADLEKHLAEMSVKGPVSGRKASQEVLKKLGDLLPYLYGGSADLSGSDCTMMSQFPIITPDHFGGRNVKYGIREFGMAAIAAGMWQTGMIRPYVGTFFTFSDYMRNAIRLAALSHYRTIYQFTHDSIFLGEDGPTHQAVEQLASLRAMPNLWLFRPADSWEVRGSWVGMLEHVGPSAIVLTRQNLPELELARAHSFRDGVLRGAYILKKEARSCDFCLMATGSEVSLALDVAAALEKMGKGVRVVSMPCWALFERQSDEYKREIIGGNLGVRVSIEAGVSLGWHRWIGPEGIAICMEGFGLSAPMGDLAAHFGFQTDAIVERLIGGGKR